MILLHAGRPSGGQRRYSEGRAGDGGPVAAAITIGPSCAVCVLPSAREREQR
jgi:hypothetical protein